MNSYLLISSREAKEPRTARFVRELRSGVFLLSDEKDFISLHLALANADEFPPESALLELAHPFASIGVDAKAKDSWEISMTAALADSIQLLRGHNEFRSESVPY